MNIIPENHKIYIFKENINRFCIIDYFTDIGLNTAKGKLISISNSGDIHIIHLNDNSVSWGFNINQIRNYKFRDLKEEGFK